MTSAPVASSIEIRWLGHAGVLVDVAGRRLAFDPVTRTRVAHIRRRGPLRSSAHGSIDEVYLSHAHHDHLDLGSLRRIARASDVAAWHAPRGAARVLDRAGFVPVVRRRVGDVSNGVGYDVVAVPAAHGGERLPWSHDEAGAEAVGYVIRPRAAPSVWFAGDTDYDESLAQVGQVDVALVPIGGWWRTLGPAHMDPRRAARAVALVGARIAIPIHWGTYHPIGLYGAMRRIWFDPAREFEQAMRRVAPDVDVRVLDVDGATRVDGVPPSIDIERAP